MAASVQGIIWPKIFWEFLTKKFDGAVTPFPILPVINLALSLLVLAWEWPLKFLAGTILHKSIKAKLIALPFPILAAALIYQGTDPAIYYLVGIGIDFWAAKRGEAVQCRCGRPHHHHSWWKGYSVSIGNQTRSAPLQALPPSKSIQTQRALSI